MMVSVDDKNNSWLSEDELLARGRLGWLISGKVSEQQFWLLIGISSMHSEKVIKALFDYLVNGISRKKSCCLHQVNSGHFSIGLSRLQYLSHAAAKLSQFY
ncbi:TPA: transcriptional regulator [Escherichia coli]|nr:transcriptional regulator [Escherichia coli]